MTCRSKAIAELSDAVTTGLYKIAREALTNALHHADARRIDISLAPATRGRHRSARLLIEDDGIGFVVDDRPEGGHYGTVMMEEQATLIGGALTIDSRPGHGTRVEVVVPLVANEVAVM